MNCICCGTQFSEANSTCPRCHWNPNAVHDKTAGYAVGDIINGRYEVGLHLGVGTFGVAIKAQDLEENRPVVVKVIHPALLPDSDTQRQFVAGMKQRISLEHPHLAAVYDAGEDGDNCYFVRELLLGVNLKQLMADQQIVGQVFPTEEAVHIIERLSSALTAKDECYHGFFCPSKIWVLAKGMKVVDYGVSRHLPPAAVWHLQKSGDEGRYVAPELMDNRPPEGTTDVYALGVLLGEMLSLVEYDGRVECFREAEPDLSLELEALIRCALSADPDGRYADAIEFVSALFDVTGRERTSAMPPDQTAVVPTSFLSQLRSLSEVPVLEDEEVTHVSEMPDDDEGVRQEVITRQVYLDDEDVEEEYELEIISEPPSPPPSSSFRPSGYRPTDLSALGRAKQAESERQAAGPPLSAPPPLPSAQPPLPKPSVSPAPRSKASTVNQPKELPKPLPSLQRSSAAARKRPPEAASSLTAAEEERGASSSSEQPSTRLEGINPRFLRAAAKLEEARISQVVIDEVADVPDTDEEAWRKQLEESSAGSVVSFLSPVDSDESKALKGFPKNQQPQQSKIPPVPRKRGKRKPPPPPVPAPRRK